MYYIWSNGILYVFIYTESFIIKLFHHNHLSLLLTFEELIHHNFCMLGIGINYLRRQDCLLGSVASLH